MCLGSPSVRNAAVLDLSLYVAGVVVVAGNNIPRDIQRAIREDVFESVLPGKWIIGFQKTRFDEPLCRFFDKQSITLNPKRRNLMRLDLRNVGLVISNDWLN